MSGSGTVVDGATASQSETEGTVLMQTQQPGLSNTRTYGSTEDSHISTSTDNDGDQNTCHVDVENGDDIKYRSCCESTTRCCCLPCSMGVAICTGLCGCYKYNKSVSNRRLETTRRTLRAGSKNLPRVVPIIRLMTDRAVPTWLPCVPGGARVRRTRLTDATIASGNSTLPPLCGKWAYPRSRCSVADALRDPDGTGARFVLYLHGGAFALCKPQTMHDIIIRYALTVDAYVLCIDYRRPPAHKHPVALNDCVFAYQWLLRQVPAHRIVIAGESAGGGLASMTLSTIVGLGLPVPCGAALVSPWVDLSDTHSASFAANAAYDYLPVDMIRMFAAMYAGKPADPTASAKNHSLEGFPPVFLQAGGSEVLLSQIEAFHQQLRDAGVHVEFDKAEGMMHVSPLFAITQAAGPTQGLSRICDFLSNRLSNIPLPSASGTRASPSTSDVGDVSFNAHSDV
eukprot:m.928756 g.928756  ORF g.928756 m.928756 type:complete len:455 (-) comp23779_c1_seq8:1776-3140(-)